MIRHVAHAVVVALATVAAWAWWTIVDEAVAKRQAVKR